MSTQDNLMIELENYKEVRPSDLNMRKTVKNVELLITAYKQEAIKAGVRAAPKVTASYSIVPPTYGNDFHSTTESAALDNIEKFEKMEYFVKKSIRDWNESNVFWILNEENDVKLYSWTSLLLGLIKLG
ncbi:hypothetical protein BFR40_01810 [Brochothrix thermosphacta]|uniref:hypothetical protein n=1 Tax=Brochothrix thermosphacta TaxID=2756 RepID=UPI00083F6248|nr:hypothetical protein [Brochothrix thermosphacta]ODJ53375.1 hypothetical protein BFR40_01810 [Brochothrix thermosphacta]WKK68115.1 hypothetical protein Q0G00_07250 [Brochothrix thermosphacta]